MNVPIEIDPDLTVYPKARKPHTCSVCRKPVPVGTVYRKVSGRLDQKLYAFAQHLQCVEVLPVKA